jgi:Tripartite tricarboxylate transporter TctB family
MTLDDRLLVSRRTLELATALVIFAMGAAVVAGALEYKIGWDDGGPQPGYFPFYVGLVIMGGALGAAAQAIVRTDWCTTASITREQAARVGTFFAPIVVFVALCSLVGIYLAMALYLLFTMRLQGGYGWVRSVAVALGTAIAFFVMFEFLFGQPLLKGPVEGWLGFQ